MSSIQSSFHLRKFLKRACLDQIIAFGLSAFFVPIALAQDPAATVPSVSVASSATSGQTAGADSLTTSTVANSQTNVADNPALNVQEQAEYRSPVKRKKPAPSARKRHDSHARKAKVMDMQIVPPLPTVKMSDRVNPFGGTGINISKPMMTIPR